MNTSVYRGDLSQLPASTVSPWSRVVHPVIAGLAGDFLAELPKQGVDALTGLYGVLLAADGDRVQLIKAAPIRLSRQLGLSALRLAGVVPTLNGDSVSVDAVFSRPPDKQPKVPESVDANPTGRMFAHAITQGWIPLLSTEVWYDGPEADGLRCHGQCYPASRGRCRPLLRAMLGNERFLEMDALEPPPPTAFALDTVYEDRHIAVVDKPPGLLSVPGLSDVPDVQSIMQTRYGERASLAHRLDQATSGLLTCAKTRGALRFLQQMFASRRVGKTYEAVLDGVLDEDAGQIDLPLLLDPLDRPRQRIDPAGKAALTAWKKIGIESDCTRVEFKPHTGRTHQLRVHAAHRQGLATPIFGDELYGKRAGRLYLHARDLVLPQLENKAPLRVSAPAPF